MIIFTVLLLALLGAALVGTIVALTCGAGIIALFGDVIVCGLIIWLLVKLFRRKK